MADMSKLKKGRGLGAPPPLEEASPNLAAPEVAPASPPTPLAPAPAPLPSIRRDGRTLRKTNRTVAFATRVTQDFDDRVREIAEQTGLKIVEVLEAALAAYERENHAAR
ncbi:hypothetical protein [Acidocella aminolytica]|uniref:Stability/partitioning determinant n=1 Tax=Acidocella aminolytica 101 = DSM 11237 TaxID=1120923 RepID=A0A0D6PK95_9PROT|nr:hypothetical protein [Acidocella aminolytica]GAN82235.1 hypothetical protein Aam_189_005 [Acidocella aminolytica 101 = DSM 11237]GBQ32385.1 hypothetical protein AA11237_0143 [Acidocella aminolytica 101 = DSM 11237]